MAKTISQLYHGAHATLAARQNEKYRNPITVAPAAPPAVLARAVLAKTISAEHARKLATRLGRKSYGEIGLTSGVVDGLLDEVLGFGALDWTVKMQLSHDLAA
jgi:hypothetical protein